jgi:hypothetical protein
MDDEHKTICAVDIAGFGGMSRTRANYVALREGMYCAVEQAFLQSGIPWSDCYQEGAGDSILTLAPANVGKGAFAEKLPVALVSALQSHNEVHPPEEQVRLRLVLHAGEITRDKRGVTAPAIIHAFRLLDAPALKEALKDSRGVLAIAASAWFYDEVVRHHPQYAPEEYVQVVVEVKETSSFAWIRLPDGERPGLRRLPALHEDHEIVTRPVRRGPMRDEPVFYPVTVHPASPEFYQVVDAVEAIPCMQNEHTRTLVVEQLRFAGSVRYFPNRRAHVTSVLRTCLDFEDGIVQLLTAISGQEPSGSIPLNRLVALLTGGS